MPGVAVPDRVSLGRYPTPVERVDVLSSPSCELWIKRDDLTHEVYGGNKVRKLEHLLGRALARRTRRIVTVGAAGSHHVLATTYFGARLGLDVEAVLLPQPRTEHALEVLRADVAIGLRAFPVRSRAAAVPALVARLIRGARYLPIGGSSIAGSMGYVDAARELATQIREGVLPEPDVCVVALGSGGTAAGLAAGFAAEGLKTVVAAIVVADPAWLVRLVAVWLARGCARRAGVARKAEMPMRERLGVDDRFLGAGYGHATEAGDEATRVAHQSAGLVLDPTYTAKAFAAALHYLRTGRVSRVLYWHTLSSAPLSRLLTQAAPAALAEPPRLSKLLL